jgi:hypothetical protein
LGHPDEEAHVWLKAGARLQHPNSTSQTGWPHMPVVHILKYVEFIGRVYYILLSYCCTSIQKAFKIIMIQLEYLETKYITSVD